jgi:hypothetical protein
VILRFKVTFTNIKGKRFDYCVATLFGEYKAVALAAAYHQSIAPKDRIYKVASVEALAGEIAEGSDIVDRMEW